MLWGRAAFEARRGGDRAGGGRAARKVLVRDGPAARRRKSRSSRDDAVRRFRRVHHGHPDQPAAVSVLIRLESDDLQAVASTATTPGTAVPADPEATRASGGSTTSAARAPHRTSSTTCGARWPSTRRCWNAPGPIVKALMASHADRPADQGDGLHRRVHRQRLWLLRAFAHRGGARQGMTDAQHASCWPSRWPRGTTNPLATGLQVPLDPAFDTAGRPALTTPCSCGCRGATDEIHPPPPGVVPRRPHLALLDAGGRDAAARLRSPARHLVLARCVAGGGGRLCWSGCTACAGARQALVAHGCIAARRNAPPEPVARRRAADRGRRLPWSALAGAGGRARQFGADRAGRAGAAPAYEAVAALRLRQLCRVALLWPCCRPWPVWRCWRWPSAGRASAAPPHAARWSSATPGRTARWPARPSTAHWRPEPGW